LFENGLAQPMDVALGSLLLASFTDIPDGFDTFVFDEETKSVVRIPAQSPQAQEALQRFSPPLFAVPGAKIVYAGFPRPDQLPHDLDPDKRRAYERFWQNRDQLHEFGANPTPDGYRLWESVLAHDREA
jgi:hypothetical protein